MLDPIGPSLARVTWLRIVNAYLVREDDGLTLVDALVPRAEGRLLAAAGSLGAPIVRIVLTHAHQDHVGALDALVARLGDVEILASAREARLVAGDKRPEPGEPADAKLRGGWPKLRTRVSRTLAPGDRVGSLEVHASPGHTPGHIALLDVRDRTLLCGDAYSTLGGVATSGRPNPRFPLPALASWHRPTAVESARSLLALQPQRLAPGHGRVVHAPGEAMAAAVARGAG